MVVQFNELTDSQWESLSNSQRWIIKEFLDTQRKRRLDLSKVVNIPMQMCRTGTKWHSLK